MTSLGREFVCWEALQAHDPLLGQVRRLYEQTLDAAERIPWSWLLRAVADRGSWRPGQWARHLILAAPRAHLGPRRVSGFVYGIHLPGFGGYACYLAVAPEERRRGLGSRLLQVLVRFLQADAACEGTDLPLVIWESRMPRPDAPAGAQAAWQARLRLFARVGAWWVQGLTLWTPNFQEPAGAPVPLQLFLLPVARAAESFDAAVLRHLAAELLQRVYGQGPGDRLYVASLPPGCTPRLRPVSEALPVSSDESRPEPTPPRAVSLPAAPVPLRRAGL